MCTLGCSCAAAAAMTRSMCCALPPRHIPPLWHTWPPPQACCLATIPTYPQTHPPTHTHPHTLHAAVFSERTLQQLQRQVHLYAALNHVNIARLEGLLLTRHNLGMVMVRRGGRHQGGGEGHVFVL